MTGSDVYTISTAFEVKVRSQSLCALEQEENDTDDVEVAGAASLQSSSNSLQMWSTKETGACVLTALLLRLEPVESTALNLL